MPDNPGPEGGLSIVIPAYNEAGRIGDSLKIICAWLRDGGRQAEILVVDDGSQDGTARLAAEILAAQGAPHRVLTGRPNRGKGFSVREGAAAARRPWTLITDADLSTPIAEVESLLAAARGGPHDLVMGSRALAGSRVGVRQSWLRMNLGRSFNLVVRLITGLPFHDTQCGFKLMDRKRVRPLFERMVVDRFAFDVEFLFLCVRFGLQVREIAVIWRNAPGSKVSLIADPLNMLWDVARVRWRFRRGDYNPAGAEDTARETR